MIIRADNTETSEIIIQKRWIWIDHAFRMDNNSINVRTCLKNVLKLRKKTWRRAVETESLKLGMNNRARTKIVAKNRDK